MKRFLLFAVLGLAFIMDSVPVQAQSQPMTEAHIEQIRANCIEAQTSLQQLHANDALQRIDRGRTYETISTKLMAPFNSRVSLARADSLNLTTITSQYERRLNDFRAAYKTYEESLSNVLKVNCMNQPVAFYDAVADTRTRRKEVYETTQAIKSSIREYRVEFGAFRVKFEGSPGYER
jgi:predicted Zn-dependent protease